MGRIRDFFFGKQDKTKSVTPKSFTSYFISLGNSSDYESELQTISKYNPWVSACIRAIVVNAKRWNFRLMNKSTENDVEKHPMLDIIENPNPFMNKKQFFSFMTYSYLFDGNAYAQAILIGKTLSGLFPEPFGIMDMQRKNDESGYTYLLDGKAQPDGTITHWKDDTFTDSYGKGVSKLTNLLFSVTQANYADRFNTSNLKNGGVPSGVLETERDVVVTDKNREEILEAWKSRHGSPDKAGKLAVLPPGAKYTQIGQSTKDMNFEALKNLSQKEVLALYGVPPVIISQTESVNYANAKEQRRIFWESCMMPIAESFIDYLNGILKFYFGETELTFYLDKKAIPELQDDLDAKLRTAVVAVNMLSCDKKDVFSKLDIPFEAIEIEPEPEPDKEDDTGKAIKTIKDLLTVEPGIVIDTDKQVRFNPDTIALPKVKVAHREGVRSLMGDLKEQTLGKFNNDISKHFLGMRNALFDFVRETLDEPKKSITDNFMNSLNTYLQGVKANDAAAIKTIAFRNLSNVSNVVVANMLEYFKMNYAAKVQELMVIASHTNNIVGVNDTVYDAILQATAKSLETGISAPELASKLHAEYKDLFKQAEKRALTIANTEQNSFANEMMTKNYKENGVEKKGWLTSRDILVRGNPAGKYPDSEADHFILDGEVVLIDASFSNGLQYPSDQASGNAAEVINCRCTTVPEIE